MPRTSPHRYDAYEKAHEKDTLERVRARRKVLKMRHGKPIPPGEDVDHKLSIKGGGGNSKKNLRLRSAHANRGDKTYF
jgi:hypothetical protein